MQTVITNYTIDPPVVDINKISEPDLVEEQTLTKLKKGSYAGIQTDVFFDEVAVIGDIHGTTKFIDGYEHILKHNNQVKKIVVLGDHFDPYDNISIDTMEGRYKDFLDCMKNDDRIVSLLGNHDLATYIIDGDTTSRTSMFPSTVKRIRSLIESNLENSRLIFKYGNCIFSHAGVSEIWIEEIAEPIGFDFEKLKKTGWNKDELTALVSYYEYDFSGYGNNAHQGPTWLRPYMLIKYPYGDYDQVVGHTMLCYEENRKFCLPGFIDRVEMNGDFCKIKMNNGKDAWFADNSGKPEYLVLDIQK